MRLLSFVLTAAFFTLCLGLTPVVADGDKSPGSANEESALPQKYLKICKFGTPFLVPWLDDLNLCDQDYGFHSMNAWAFARGDIALDTRDVIYANGIDYLAGEHAGTTLGRIMDRPSSFGAGTVHFSRPYRPGEWEKELDLPDYNGPRKIGSTAITSRLIIPNVRLFGQPVLAKCLHDAPYTLPVEHDNAYCFLTGITPDNGIVSMQVRTDPNRDGHWPISPGPWTEKDWSPMQAPLNEIEEIWHQMRKGGESFSCN